MVRNMAYIDLHCDTILPVLERDLSLRASGDIQVTFEGMQKGAALAQCFAVWMPSEMSAPILAMGERPKGEEEDLIYIRQAYSRLHREAEKNADLVKLGGDIRENAQQGKMTMLLTMEDLRAVYGKMERLAEFCDMGFRMGALLWNHENCFGYPNSTDENINQKGLKDFGKEAIPVMNDLNFIVDVSHLNDAGIRDVLSISKKPVVASHSNCRSLCAHSRNLTDEQIKGIADTGGVIGLCFSPGFLSKGASAATISDMIRHLEHVLDVGGEEALALGTDFDGTEGEMEIARSEEIPKLFEALETIWPTERIERFAYKNAMRIFS